MASRPLRHKPSEATTCPRVDMPDTLSDLTPLSAKANSNFNLTPFSRPRFPEPTITSHEQATSAVWHARDERLGGEPATGRPPDTRNAVPAKFLTTSIRAWGTRELRHAFARNARFSVTGVVRSETDLDVGIIQRWP